MSHQGFGFCEFVVPEDAEYACRIMNQVGRVPVHPIVDAKGLIHLSGLDQDVWQAHQSEYGMFGVIKCLI